MIGLKNVVILLALVFLIGAGLGSYGMMSAYDAGFVNCGACK